jgi:hypothetical protein
VRLRGRCGGHFGLAVGVVLTVATVLCAATVVALLVGSSPVRPAAAGSPRPTTVAAAAAHVTMCTARPRRVPTAASWRRAVAYLKARDCVAALAVVDTRGRLRGYRADVGFTSASVVKAMLLVQYLRSHRVLAPGARATLKRMITESDNDAAYWTYGVVGACGLRRLADVAGMRHFSPGDDVLYSRITAADQARFFARIDDYLPRTRRRFARYLLSHIVRAQTWGVAQVARPRWTVFFKSGWFGAAEDPYTLVNQVARLERGRAIWSVAILTAGNPHSPYAFQTLRGVARRLLGSDGR